MNISRLFIVRRGDGPADDLPRAVVLVSVGFLPVSSLPDVDYPTIQSSDILSGRQPAGDVDHRSPRRSKVQLGHIPGLQQMISSSSSTPRSSPCSSTVDGPRCRRACDVQETSINAATAAVRPAPAGDSRPTQVNPALIPSLPWPLRPAMSLTPIAGHRHNRLAPRSPRCLASAWSSRPDGNVPAIRVERTRKLAADGSTSTTCGTLFSQTSR